MEGLRMQVELKDFPAVMDRLADARARAQDMTPLMEQIGFYNEQATKERFDRGVDPDGRPWKPSIRVKMEGGETLKKSGQLRDSITSEASSHRAVWGTNLLYASVHQLGMTIFARSAKALRFFLPGIGLRFADHVTIPQRAFVGINAQDEREMAALAEAYLEEPFQ